MARWGVRLSLILLAGWTFPSFANFLIEPLVGEQFAGNQSFTETSVSDSGTFSGLAYGGRLGVDVRSFFFGGEYLGMTGINVSFSSPNTWSTTNSSTMTMNSSNIGAFVGWEWMRKKMPLRFIATYFFSSTANLSNSSLSSPTSLTLTGNGFKGEIDVRLGKRVSFGAAYYFLDFSEVKNNTAGTSASASAHQGAALISLSFPIEL